MASLLLPGYEVEPTLKVMVGYSRMIDSGATPYRVQSSDNFATLAIYARMSPGDLLRYNFGTSVPREVNWYLRNHVGCKKADWDEKNYVFSDDDDPGVIFVPLRAYKALLEAGYTPRKVVEDENFEVTGRMYGYSQTFSKNCWAAAFGMMLAHKHGHMRLGDLLEKHAGAKWRAKLEDGTGIYTDDVPELASDCGLKPFKSRPKSYDDWLGLVRRKGPLCVGQHAAVGWDHWMVAYGFRKVFPDTRLVVYKEPLTGRSTSDHIENIDQSNRKYSGSEARPAFYHF